ncbi:MAG: hypothetical protein L6Q84_24390 [Polyangiaceae bacterium]|nr:hypothetical protein [Polyangiaceae bacterium]
MSKQKIAHLRLLAKPEPAASSNVAPLRPPVEPEFDTSVLVELVDGGASVHVVIDGESYDVGRVTGGPPNRPEVLLRVARQFGEQALGEILKDQSLEDLMAWVYAQETPAAVARQAKTALQARERVRQHERASVAAHQAEQAEKRRRANEARAAGGKKGGAIAGRGRPKALASREATPKAADPARPDKTATAIAREAGCGRATVELILADALSEVDHG